MLFPVVLIFWARSRVEAVLLITQKYGHHTRARIKGNRGIHVQQRQATHLLLIFPLQLNVRSYRNSPRLCFHPCEKNAQTSTNCKPINSGASAAATTAGAFNNAQGHNPGCLKKRPSTLTYIQYFTATGKAW